MKEEERTELVRYRFRKAQDTLLEVDVLIRNNLWNTAVNRLYYASYYAVIALLVRDNIAAQTHSGVRKMFGLHFIRTGLISKESGKVFTDLFDKRLTGDYEDFIDLSEEDVKSFIRPVKQLLFEIETILQKR